MKHIKLSDRSTIYKSDYSGLYSFQDFLKLVEKSLDELYDILVPKD